MSYNAGLATNHYIVTNFCAAANARKCCYYCITTYLYIVSYLQQIIKLGAGSYNSTSYSSSINGSIASYFYTVFNNYIANLRNFFKTAIGLWCKAKAITAYYCACMYYYFAAYNTIVVYFYAGVNNAVVTYNYIIPNISIWIYFYTFPYYYIFSQVSKCANKNILPFFYSWVNIYRLLYTNHLLCL